MHVFYQEDFDPIHNTILNAEESHHALKVLRLKVGDTLLITNGKGVLANASIQAAQGKTCQLHVLETKYLEQETPQIHLAVAPTKNSDRMEWLVEKACEIGISRITPIVCAHSERKVFKTDRIKKVAIAAMKQSQQAWLPQIDEPIALKELIASNTTPSKFIAHCRASTKTDLKKAYAGSKNHALILIGPEGDFNEQEIQECIAKQFVPVSIGNKRLRTETAALIAVHTLLLENQ